MKLVPSACVLCVMPGEGDEVYQSVREAESDSRAISIVDQGSDPRFLLA